MKKFSTRRMPEAVIAGLPSIPAQDFKSLFDAASDNGVGFDTSLTAKGIGLKNIQNRADLYSGKMNIISAPGQGCTVEIELSPNHQTEPT